MLDTLSGGRAEPRLAALRSIRGRNGAEIDRGLVVWFPGPHSFTGEDCAEVHLHGGRAVVDRILEELGGFDDARMAEAGEFSRRAFVNGKIDLTEAEGLADLIASETEAQRALALAQSSGALREVYEDWQARLLHARAMIEAEIDFADEEDVPGSVAETVWTDMAALAGEMQRHLEGSKAGSIIREGFRIAIVGAPNAGKSSLLNALAGSDVAIVSDIAGTTRDAIETRIVLDGNLVVLTDTAGLRDSDDPIEAEGIRRTHMCGRRRRISCCISPMMAGWPRSRRSCGRARVAYPFQGGRGRVLSAGAAGDLGAGKGRAGCSCSPVFATILAQTLSRSQMALPSRMRHADNVRTALAGVAGWRVDLS